MNRVQRDAEPDESQEGAEAFAKVRCQRADRLLDDALAAGSTIQ
jgi:hypothetical protein